MSSTLGALVINSENSVQTEPPFYQYKYRFPTAISFQDLEVCPSTIIVPYSWFNFSSVYQNNTFTYRWVDGSVNTVSLGDGYYGAQEINLLLESVMIANKHYLVNATGNFVYYLNIQANPVFYSIQLNSNPVPTAAQATTLNLTLPAGATWALPGAATNPQFIIPAPTANQYNTSFSNAIGFAPGDYPPAQTPGAAYSALSTETPQINPVTSVVVLCTLLDNRFSLQNQVLYTFNVSDVAFGQYVSLQIPQSLWSKCSGGSFSEFTLSFVDQTLRNPIPFRDNTITIQMNVRRKP